MFSSRVPGDLRPNRLSEAIRRARAGDRPLLDLTVSNPTRVGIDYPPSLLVPLSGSASRFYDPSPFGLEGARRAVAADYLRRGIVVATERIVLTASTSEAYSLLFKLLCESDGDAVMVPAPSYPLFDHLTRLDGVGTSAYRLEYHGRWMLDVAGLDEVWSESIRAALAVTPNNPTGSTLSEGELDALATRCAERDAALILDEVFADYPLDEPEPPNPRTLEPPSSRAPSPESRAPSPESRAPECLLFRLGGLSKSAGLPQVKLGWIAVDGPAALVAAALERLELICDTYLSVSTPVQVAAPELIEHGAVVRQRIRERVRSNYRALTAAATDPAVEVLHADAGWSAVLRVPSTRSEEDLAIALLEEDGVVVHPGFFFDFPHEAFLVVSLLPEPPVFREGVARLLERIRG